MPIMLKRRYPSSSSSDSSPCWALRPVKKLPTRHGRQVRKVQRIASTHSTIPIPPTLQSHRSKEAAFSSTDTELSSSDTELGTALSDVESAINHPDSSPGMRLSSPERESDEIDDSLGDARMSYSPSPPPAGWAWKDGKMVYDIPVQVSFSEKGKGVEGNDRKRRRLEVVEQQQEEEDEADDEMEAENMLSTPKQKVKRKTRMWGTNEKTSRAAAPTPSILGITERLNGLTPYCMEMQLSPNQTQFLLDTKTPGIVMTPQDETDDDKDDELVSNALIPSPSPPPRQKRRSKSRSTRYIASESSSTISEAKKRTRQRLSASEKRQKERMEPYARDFFPQLEALKTFTHFDLTGSWDSPEPSSSVWSYGPLSSPIRLGADSPRKPIKCRILLGTLPGQRTRPNRNLQRRSPTSLIPSRHRGRHPPRPSRTGRSLAIFGPTTLVGQHVVTYIHQAKAAREKRRNAVSRQNALVDYPALAKLRSNCLEGLGKVEAWKNLLWEIQKGCWWWQTAVPSQVATQVPASRRIASAEEVQVESLVDAAEVTCQVESDVATVDALVNASSPAEQQATPVTAVSSTSRQSAVGPSSRHRSGSVVRHSRTLGGRRAPYADPGRVIRAEAAQRRIGGDSNSIATEASDFVIPRTSETSEVDRDGFESETAAHRERMASRAFARREQEAQWATSADRAAEQRKSLGRQATEVDIARETIRHVSSLHPTHLSAAGPSNPIVAPEAEVEDTDTESDTESTASDPPAYDSSSYPRFIPCPPHVHPRRPPPPIEVRLPSYGPNRYSRRSPSPPPPYNAETDRQTLVVPIFIGEDDEDEDEGAVLGQVGGVQLEPRVIGAFPSSNRWAERQDRFDAAPEMEEADLDADEIDELTGGYEGGLEGERPEGGALGAIGGFLRGFFGRR